MKHFCHVLLSALLVLLATGPVLALVNPESTEVPVQSWLVDIHVVGADDALHFFCKGALIDKRWVLTAAPCLFDPYKALEAAADESDPDYVVVLGGTTKAIKVTDFVQSDDFRLGMMHLDEDVAATPIRLSTRTEASLLNTDVHILGTERSAGIAHSYFNPSFGSRMSCDLNGALFISGSSATGGAICYLHAKPEAGPALYMTRARVINPATPGAPNSTLDTTAPFDRSGARLYLDFRASGSYPCHEDIGSPVLLSAADGSRELVGVVTAVGMAAGLPMCSPVLLNTFTNVAFNKGFIEKTMSAQGFEALCPPTPELIKFMLGEHRVLLYWDEVSGASGYKLHFTTRAGYQPIKTIDMKNLTDIRTDLVPGTTYTVALSAYNATCSSALSELVIVAN